MNYPPMSMTLSPANTPHVGREEAAPRPTVAPPAAPGASASQTVERAPEPKRVEAPVASASLNMSFQVGSSQSGLTLRLTDSVSGEVVREIKLESEAGPEGTKRALQGQIVDLRA